MSSHREAPQIATDPSADNTDVYAFVSPDAPDKVTIIANFMPFELPYGGPNFNEFSDEVSYEINISNRGLARKDIKFRFQFFTSIRNPNTFLYNVGPISSPTDPNWNRPQSFQVTAIRYDEKGNKDGETTSERLPCPPVNVGVRSTPNYPKLAAKAVHDLGYGVKVFAGQRADAFHVDLGSIFDLGDLRPFQEAYNKAIPPILSNMPGVNGLKGLNVHTIAIQVPIKYVTRDGKKPTDVMSPNSVIGVWANAYRQTSRVINTGEGTVHNMGGWSQVSRLANPLVNEVLIPMAKKDRWNAQVPKDDKQFDEYVLHPELATLISKVLYPTAFPNLAKYVDANKPRNDLHAILHTGIPAGVVPGFQNYTGPIPSDMVRLNVAVPPTKPSKQSPYGLLGGDAAGFPNGRRLGDDVVAIELRAIAGLTIPLVDPTYTPDDAAKVVNDGTKNDNTPYESDFLPNFPYMPTPNSGFTTKPGKPGGSKIS